MFDYNHDALVISMIDAIVPAGSGACLEGALSIHGGATRHEPPLETSQMPRGRPRKFPSLADLKSMLAEGRRQRGRLLKERKKLQARIDQVDREIQSLDGAGAGRGRRGRRNDLPLRDVIESVLKRSSKPMRVGDIVNAVEASGYRSGSANFRGIVNQTLIKEKRFTSPSRGLYQAK